MSFILIAIVVVLLLLVGVGVYLATRPAPAATVISTGACTPGSCPIPLSCDTTSGKCVDNTLPGAISAARNSAGAFYNALLALIVDAQTLTAELYMINATLLELKYIGYSGTTGAQSTIANLIGQLTSLIGSLSSFINKELSAPGCGTTGAIDGQCGYYALLNAFTPSNENAGQVISAGLQGIALAKFTIPYLTTVQTVVNYATKDMVQSFKQMWQDYNVNYVAPIALQIINSGDPNGAAKIQAYNVREMEIVQMLNTVGKGINDFSTASSGLTALNKASLVDGAALVAHYDIPDA